MGYSPFGIDGGGIFNSADPKDESLKKVYRCLKNIAPFIQENRGTDNMSALFVSEEGQSDKVEMGIILFQLEDSPQSTYSNQPGVNSELKEKRIKALRV